MSFKTYRVIDLVIWLAILAFGELLASFAANSWFPIDSFAVSLVFPVLLIVLMRWGWWALPDIIIGAVLTCVFSDISGGQAMSLQSVLISVIGNLCMLFGMLLFYLFGKKNVTDGKYKIKGTWYYSLVYAAALYLPVNLGYATVNAIINGGGFIGILGYYLGLNSVTLLFAAVIVLIVRRIDGLFEDQRTYLIKLERLREEERKKKNTV